MGEWGGGVEGKVRWELRAVSARAEGIVHGLHCFDKKRDS